MRSPRNRMRPAPAALLLMTVMLTAVMLTAGCSSIARGMLDRAEAAWRNNRFDEAIRANQDLYRLEPRGRYAPQALLNTGNIYYLNLRQLKPAIESYDKLTQEFPASTEALQARRRLASIYMNEEIILDLDQAIAQFDKLLEVEDLTDRQDIRFQRADAFFKKGDYSRALRELSSLEEAGVGSRLAAEISLRIGNIYLIEKRLTEAVEPFRRILASGNAECRKRAILGLEETYENLYDFDNAIETVRLLEKDPENRQFVLKEVERLNKKHKDVDKGNPLNWPSPAVKK